MTAGPSSATVSKNRRQAEKDSSREADWPASTPRSGISLALSHALSSPEGRTRSSFKVATSGESDSNTPACDFKISPNAQNVIPSP